MAFEDGEGGGDQGRSWGNQVRGGSEHEGAWLRDGMLDQESSGWGNQSCELEIGNWTEYLDYIGCLVNQTMQHYLVQAVDLKMLAVVVVVVVAVEGWVVSVVAEVSKVVVF